MEKLSSESRLTPLDLSWGFLAGFLATLIFHQTAVALLWEMGVAPGPPFQTALRPPFGIPAFLSLAFWGGAWGILFAALTRHFLRDYWRYWLTALIGGAVLPSLVALLIVIPLKGGAFGAGWKPGIWLYVLTVNGVWGVGVGLLLKGLRRLSPVR